MGRPVPGVQRSSASVIVVREPMMCLIETRRGTVSTRTDFLLISGCLLETSPERRLHEKREGTEKVKRSVLFGRKRLHDYVVIPVYLHKLTYLHKIYSRKTKETKMGF